MAAAHKSAMHAYIYAFKLYMRSDSTGEVHMNLMQRCAWIEWLNRLNKPKQRMIGTRQGGTRLIPDAAAFAVLRDMGTDMQLSVPMLRLFFQQKRPAGES